MSTADAPSGLICNVCDIYELAGAKSRAKKAFRGPKYSPGTSRRLSAVSHVAGQLYYRERCVRGIVAMHGRSGLIDCQVSHHTHSVVPFKAAAPQILQQTLAGAAPTTTTVVVFLSGSPPSQAGPHRIC